MEVAHFENLSPKCPICLLKYIPQRPGYRPMTLSCGHSICGRCLDSTAMNLVSPQCPTCRKVFEKSKAVISYALEEQIENVRKHEAELKRGTIGSHLCLDCRVTFVHSEFHKLSTLHTSHKTMSLGKLDDERLNEIMWLVDVLSDSSNSISRMKKVLQAILSVVDRYQQHLLEIEQSYHLNPFNWSERMWKELEPSLSTGDFVVTGLGENIFALLSLRDIQAGLGHDAIKLYLESLRTDIKQNILEESEKNLNKEDDEHPADSQLADKLKEVKEGLDLLELETKTDSGIKLLPGTQLRSLIADSDLKIVKIEAKTQPVKPDSNSLCFTCKVHFEYSKEKKLGLDHENHIRIDLGAVSEESKQLMMWISEFIKDPADSLERMKKFLQMMLSAADAFQSHLKAAEEGFLANPESWTDLVWVTLLKTQGCDNPPELIKSLILLQKIQAALGPSLIKYALPLLRPYEKEPEMLEEQQAIVQSDENIQNRLLPGHSHSKLMKNLEMKVVRLTAQ